MTKNKETRTGTILSTHYHEKGHVIMVEMLRHPADEDCVVYCKELEIEILCKSWSNIDSVIQEVRERIDEKLTA